GSEIGDHATICAQTGLAGSTVVGKFVFLAGRAASAGHLTIGDGAIVGAQSSAASDVAPGAQVLGYPAIERRLWTRVIAASKRLPELVKRVARLERKLGVESEE